MNGDALTVAIEDGSRTEIGSYTARAVALAGGRRATMCCRGASFRFRSEGARDGSCHASTVTAVIDGLTIRLTGFATGADHRFLRRMPWPRAIHDHHGVTYTIDRSAVDVRRAGDHVRVCRQQCADQRLWRGRYRNSVSGRQCADTFDGWKIGDKTYDALTEEALTKLNGTQTAAPVFTAQQVEERAAVVTTVRPHADRCGDCS